MSDFKYVGSELELFSDVWNWKNYWSSQIRPYLKGDILEVGAGIGSNTRLLDTGGTGRWVCLEPDPELTGQLSNTLASHSMARNYEIICGTLESLPGQLFDTIIYIDVLEHIEHDAEEMKNAASHLRPGGHLIVLSPAHQAFFSPFDTAIGHFRRYNRTTLLAAAPANVQLERMRYLDCAGMILSASNMLLLKQSMPTKGQLGIWDRYVVPVSRVFDRVFNYSLGKTIIGIWKL